MRKLRKLTIPSILQEKQKEWTEEFIKDYTNGKKDSSSRYRYRDDKIKEVLKTETSNKCVYCESKIGHNTPGDIEHIVPTSKSLELHYDWENLTMACTECNRRKNDFYKTGDDFLNPYCHDVEKRLIAVGPIIFWLPGDKTAEITVKILEFNNNKRLELILQKTEKLKEVQERVERYVNETNTILKAVLKEDLISLADIKSEYSFAILQYLINLRILISE